jgi:hypothetical protein
VAPGNISITVRRASLEDSARTVTSNGRFPHRIVDAERIGEGATGEEEQDGDASSSAIFVASAHLGGVVLSVN